jgi:hypothetical protein
MARTEGQKERIRRASTQVVPIASTAQGLEVAMRRAWQARYQAASIGDYAAAERWHAQARALAALLKLGARRQPAPARP